MYLKTTAELKRLIDAKVPEGPGLEYKSSLTVSSRRDRLEALKDLSGMGNGGGGTVVFGLVEDPQSEGVPTRLAPLSDRGVGGVLEDVARSGIRPTLVWELITLELGRGKFVLVANVRRSPLGPYMIESHGESRYYIRHGTRTTPMTEQEIRDAYVLATRGHEVRAAIWENYAMPLTPPTSAPWLTVCGIPEEPLAEVFEPGLVVLEELRAVDTRTAPPLHFKHASTTEATSQLTIWADGIYGDDTYGEDRPPGALFRLHRSGAALVADAQWERISTWALMRALNAQVAYVTWLWCRFGVRNAVEIDLRLENLTEARVDDPNQFARRVREPKRPIAGPSPAVSIRRALLPGELARPSVRHRLLLDFADRLYQAFNFRRAGLLFRWGQLYDQKGPLQLAIGEGGLFDRDGNEVAGIDDRGGILNRGGYVIAFFVDGVVVDLTGRALGALELAPGSGLPDDFFPASLHNSPSFRTPGGGLGSPLPADHGKVPPVPTGQWSDESLGGLIGSSDPSQERG